MAIHSASKGRTCRACRVTGGTPTGAWWPRAVIRDSLGGRLRAEARVPMDLSIATVEKRLLSDAVDADVTVDSLRLEALSITVAGMSRVRGALAGKVVIGGTTDRPVGTGTIELSNFSLRADDLGIEPNQGRAVLRAAADSLILESFRITSGRARDTLGAKGVLRYALNEPVTIDAQFTANTAVLARQHDGTDLVLSGALDVKGPLITAGGVRITVRAQRHAGDRSAGCQHGAGPHLGDRAPVSGAE